ncbi:MAG: FAD-binding oxidoreductase [Marinoscillum sp.]
MPKPIKTSNWNSYPVVSSTQHKFTTPGDLRRLLRQVTKVITRGSGKSYGDASLSEQIISTKEFNKIVSFNPTKGTIRCESGVMLNEILEVIVPEGWFLPVVPGTKYITVGGAIAANVHGKNHHKDGSISEFIVSMSIMLADGGLVSCSQSEYPDLFNNTCGGMGLTGVIMEAELKLRPIETAYISQRNIMVPDLKSMIKSLKSNSASSYSVAWVDCLAKGKHKGRGVVMLGEHATGSNLGPEVEEKLKVHKNPKWGIPFKFPSILLNRFSIRWFNACYYHLNKRKKEHEFNVHYDKFFFPLDSIGDWNNLYGRKGFLQYQFVIPFERGDEAFIEIFNKIVESRNASFLTVLKVLGNGGSSVSFPIPGYTLAMDIPMSSKVFDFLDDLDWLVVKNGGRIYLAKDARTKRDVLHKGYAGLGMFQEIRKITGAKAKFESLLSRRLGI